MQWRHGTPTGYGQHQTAGEKPCDACTAAKSEYDRRWREATGRQKSDRLAARAQNKAETRLRRMHPNTYRILYAEELAKLKAEADQ